MNSSRFSSASVLTALALLTSALPIAAQQTCNEIDAVILQCPEGEGISGDPPACFCQGNPVEPLELTCEINFGCPTDQYIGFGEWPICGCSPTEEIRAGGGGGGVEPGGPAAVGGGLGGVDSCMQFLVCPSGSTMEVRGGQCTCTLVMLPAFIE